MVGEDFVVELDELPDFQVRVGPEAYPPRVLEAETRSSCASR